MQNTRVVRLYRVGSLLSVCFQTPFFFSPRCKKTIIKRPPGLQMQNCFQNRVFCEMRCQVKRFPSGNAEGEEKKMRFSVISGNLRWGGARGVVVWVLFCWLGVVWGLQFFVISLFGFSRFGGFLLEKPWVWWPQYEFQVSCSVGHLGVWVLSCWLVVVWGRPFFVISLFVFPPFLRIPPQIQTRQTKSGKHIVFISGGPSFETVFLVFCLGTPHRTWRIASPKSAENRRIW